MICKILPSLVRRSLGLLRSSESFCNREMLALSIMIKRNRRNQQSWQTCANKVCIMECMCVNNKTLNGLVFNTGLDLAGFDALLYQWLLSRCGTFRERTIVLDVIHEIHTLLSKVHCQIQSNTEALPFGRTVEGDSNISCFSIAPSQHWHSEYFMSFREDAKNVQYYECAVAYVIC